MAGVRPQAKPSFSCQRAVEVNGKPGGDLDPPNFLRIVVAGYQAVGPRAGAL